MFKNKLVKFLLLSVVLVYEGLAIAEIKASYIQDLNQPVSFKPFNLQDLDLNSITPEYFNSQWDWVFMGYTHCPDVCPTTLMVIAKALTIIENVEGESHNTRVTFMSIDPARDHPDKLKEYLNYFHPDFKGIAGPVNTLLQVAGEMGMTFYYGEPNKSGGYEVAHSTGVALIDPDGRIVALIKNPNDPQQIAKLFMEWRKKNIK